MKRVYAQGVSVSFSGLLALDDVSVCLDAGRVTMLVGPNGAGKSTLIKFILGLVRADQGRLQVEDRVVPIDNAWKAQIGYLPEAVAFSENLSGQQVLRFFARARGVSRQRMGEVLERVGLSSASGRRVRGYSRGMRQRLGLGVAILSTPELLILDEPTSGLDQEGLAVLWEILRDWRESGRLVLVSSHDLALMERRIDELFVLRSGRVLAQGSKEDLRHVARLPHRVWFDVDGTDEDRIQSLCDAMEKWGGGRFERLDGHLCVEVPADSILDLMEIQSGFAGVVRGLRVEEPTLDLVYEKLLEVAR
jgi:Cu-processing system ATP-binding protein